MCLPDGGPSSLPNAPHLTQKTGETLLPWPMGSHLSHPAHCPCRSSKMAFLPLFPDVSCLHPTWDPIQTSRFLPRGPCLKGSHLPPTTYLPHPTSSAFLAPSLSAPHYVLFWLLFCLSHQEVSPMGADQSVWFMAIISVNNLRGYIYLKK